MDHNLQLNKDQLFFIRTALDDLLDGVYGNEMYKLDDEAIESKTNYKIKDIDLLVKKLDSLNEFCPNKAERRLFHFALDQILNGPNAYGEEFETVVGSEKEAREILGLLKS